MNDRQSADPQPLQRGNPALWLMFLGSPVIWLLSLQISYTLVGYACLWQSRWPLLLTALVSLLLALTNALWAWRRLHALRHQPASEPAVKRACFMVQTGVWLSLLFALLIALQGAAVLILDPCRL